MEQYEIDSWNIRGKRRWLVFFKLLLAVSSNKFNIWLPLAPHKHFFNICCWLWLRTDPVFPFTLSIHLRAPEDPEVQRDYTNTDLNSSLTNFTNWSFWVHFRFLTNSKTLEKMSSEHIKLLNFLKQKSCPQILWNDRLCLVYLKNEFEALFQSF